MAMIDYEKKKEKPLLAAPLAYGRLRRPPLSLLFSLLFRFFGGCAASLSLALSWAAGAAPTENRLSTSETTGKESTITTAPLLPANPLRSIAPSETYHPFKHHLLTFLLGLLLIPTIKLLLHRLKR